MTTIADTIKKAMSTKWYNTPYSHGPVESMAWHLEGYFAERCAGRPYQLEEIDTKMIEEFVTHKQKQHHVTASTINKYLSCLSVLFDVADGIAKSEGLSGVPKPTIKRLPEKRVEKWWMPPDQLEDLLKHLRSRPSGGNRHFADFLEVLAKQGLRVKEALELEVRHIVGNFESLKVPGTKTAGAEASIPIFDACKPILQRLLDEAYDKRPKLFALTYEEAQMRWNKERIRIGLADVPTATLKALRRTFAAYATQAGMPTATLQKVMRHGSITTTQGYLRLTGDPALEEARKYMGKRPEAARADQIEMLTVALEAYRRTRATPEEVAEFTKALLRV